MPNRLSKQDCCDWIVAYREVCLINHLIDDYSEVQLFTLTKMAELAGTFVETSGPGLQEVFPELDRLFSMGSGCPGLTTRHRDNFSIFTGQGLDIKVNSYQPGENYEYFVSEMCRFWALLPITEAKGISVASGALDAIYCKLPPTEVVRLAKSGITRDLKGSELREAEIEAVPLMKKCINAAKTVILRCDHHYWDEIEAIIDGRSLDKWIEDKTLLPVFGL